MTLHAPSDAASSTPVDAASGDAPAAGVPVVVNGELVSTNPASGAEVARLPVADAEAVAAAVARARAASTWWQGLGFDGRRQRMLRWRSLITKRMDELI